jgi:neuronal PAS domain-containing protein 1/3
MGLVVVAHALPPPTINEVRIDCHMFVTRVNMDLNIIYCENRYFVFMFICPLRALPTGEGLVSAA